MNLILITILICFGIVQLAMSIVILANIANGDGFALLPGEIRSLNQLTWFGAIFLFIVFIILIPYVYICGLLRLIFKGEWFE